MCYQLHRFLYGVTSVAVAVWFELLLPEHQRQFASWVEASLARRRGSECP
jgi:hypothetical protein